MHSQIKCNIAARTGMTGIWTYRTYDRTYDTYRYEWYMNSKQRTNQLQHFQLKSLHDKRISHVCSYSWWKMTANARHPCTHRRRSLWSWSEILWTDTRYYNIVTHYVLLISTTVVQLYTVKMDQVWKATVAVGLQFVFKLIHPVPRKLCLFNISHAESFWISGQIARGLRSSRDSVGGVNSSWIHM